MNISVYEEGENIVYRISEVTEDFRKLMVTDYYTPDGDDFIKTFPKDVPNMNVIGANFKKHAETMFNQRCCTQPTPWQDALLAFIKKMEGTDIDWFLVGSCALTVRGIDVVPSDIDLIMSMRDIEKVSEIFIEDTIEPLRDCGDWVAKGYGSLFMHMLISIAFDTLECLDKPEPSDSGPYAAAHLEEIEWMGHIIKVPPVELLLNINKRRGREDRVRIIEEYMQGM